MRALHLVAAAGLALSAAVDARPNVDYLFSERLALNAGLTLGLAGDRKQDDLGATTAVLVSF